MTPTRPSFRHASSWTFEILAQRDGKTEDRCGHSPASLPRRDAHRDRFKLREANLSGIYVDQTVEIRTEGAQQWSRRLDDGMRQRVGKEKVEKENGMIAVACGC